MHLCKDEYTLCFQNTVVILDCNLDNPQWHQCLVVVSLSLRASFLKPTPVLDSAKLLGGSRPTLGLGKSRRGDLCYACKERGLTDAISLGG